MSDAQTGALSVADVYAAQVRLLPYLKPTPLHFAERFGCWMKLENLQRTGSFKVRGAMNALLAARERGDSRPVIVATSVNFARGFAWAGYRLGMTVITVLPASTPRNQVAGIAHWGAMVRLHGESHEEANSFASDLALVRNFRLVTAQDDFDIIAGQGTVGVELASLLPDVVVVPIGGGSLAAGVALALKSACVSRRSDSGRLRIVGVQVEGSDAMTRALRGDYSSIDPVASLADGACVKNPSRSVGNLLNDLLDDIMLVREVELRETIVRLAVEEHVIAEGAGALAVAACRRISNKRKCAVVSGGNIDAGVLARLISEVRFRAPRFRASAAAISLLNASTAHPLIPHLHHSEDETAMHELRFCSLLI
jgi:threonine dehydratase